MDRTFEELARRFERNPVFTHIHAYDLYRNWLEGAWAFLEAWRDLDAFRVCLDRYTREQGEEFGRLLGLYTEAVKENPFRDILGELFMRLDVNSARSGQYMTPWSIAEMMARVQFDPELFKSQAEEKGVVTVYDPAVGSGVMLLAFAKVIHDTFGRWGTSRLRLYGQDIDLRCVNMCRIQLRMNGLDGVGRVMGLMGVCQSVQAQAPGQLLFSVLLNGKVA